MNVQQEKDICWQWFNKLSAKGYTTEDDRGRFESIISDPRMRLLIILIVASQEE